MYSGYQKGQNFNTYYNFNNKAVTAYVDETALENGITGTTGINHTPDTANGTVYIQCPATGYKYSGKETIITAFPDGIDTSYDKNSTNDAPWWQAYGYKMTQPGYIVMNITYSSITVTCYAVNGTLETDANKNITVHSFEDGVTRYQIDTTTINAR